MDGRGSGGRPVVLVTGATGNVGREVVTALGRTEARVRSATRRPSREGEVLLDFERPDTFDPAVEGCDALFLVRPPAISDTASTLHVLVDRAREAGVGQVVFLSVAGAGGNPLLPHHAVERHLEEGPSGWTLLRPGFFAQNLADAYLPDIVEDDRIHVPAGDGRVAFVDLRDVGEVAAEALLRPAGHAGEAYTLTGPAAFTFDEVTAALTRAVGRPIRYEPASVPGYLLHLRRRGTGWAQALVQTVLHVGLRFGRAAEVDPTLEELLGRRPRSVVEYVRDHAGLWRREAPAAG